jgi:OmpA-OmpF porin, OOP family
MNIRLMSLGLVGALALSGCASFTYDDTVQQLKSTTAQGSAFSQRLTAEYLALAEFEAYQMYDYNSAELFGQKGLQASTGAGVDPEVTANWSQTPAHAAELDAARARLVAAFAAGARETLPETAAVAQAKFDCWMEQQEENFQLDHIAACKQEFDREIALLEAKPKAPEPMPAPMAPMVEPAKIMIFFEFDKSVLPAGAEEFLDRAVSSYGSRMPSTVDVIGHADRSGNDAYNLALSERRARTVSSALVGKGVPSSKLDTSWKGESDPLVATPDGERNMSNRRVEILIP